MGSKERREVLWLDIDSACFFSAVRGFVNLEQGSCSLRCVEVVLGSIVCFSFNQIFTKALSNLYGICYQALRVHHVAIGFPLPKS